MIVLKILCKIISFPLLLVCLILKLIARLTGVVTNLIASGILLCLIANIVTHLNSPWWGINSATIFGFLFALFLIFAPAIVEFVIGFLEDGIMFLSNVAN